MKHIEYDDRNNEQDWLKTNLARFTGMLQGQRDLVTVGKTLLSELVPLVGAHQGLIYQIDSEGEPHLKLLASYGNERGKGYPERLELGQGFLGQCAADRSSRSSRGRSRSSLQPISAGMKSARTLE